MQNYCFFFTYAIVCHTFFDFFAFRTFKFFLYFLFFCCFLVDFLHKVFVVLTSGLTIFPPFSSFRPVGFTLRKTNGFTFRNFDGAKLPITPAPLIDRLHTYCRRMQTLRKIHLQTACPRLLCSFYDSRATCADIVFPYFLDKK